MKEKNGISDKQFPMFLETFEKLTCLVIVRNTVFFSVTIFNLGIKK